MTATTQSITPDHPTVDRALRRDMRRLAARLRQLRANLPEQINPCRRSTLELLNVQATLDECKPAGVRLRLLSGETELDAVTCTTHVAMLCQWSRLLRRIELTAHRDARRGRIGAPDHLYTIAWVNRWYGALDRRPAARVATTELCGLRIECTPLG